MIKGDEYPVLSLARRLVNPAIIFLGLILSCVDRYGHSLDQGEDFPLPVAALAPAAA